MKSYLLVLDYDMNVDTHSPSKSGLKSGVSGGVARWLSGRASDLRSSSRGFEARPRRCCVTTLGKLFTPYCLCVTKQYNLVPAKAGK